ncbi:MAG: hypothetical protein U0T56_00040 [Ferruginibacter sp.]
MPSEPAFGDLRSTEQASLLSDGHVPTLSILSNLTPDMLFSRFE